MSSGDSPVNLRPPTAAIVGAVVAAIILMGLAAFLFFSRWRRLAKKPVDKISGVEWGPEPEVESSSLLDADGQPADTEDADAASQTSSKREKTGTPISAITNGIAHGASLAGDARRARERPGRTANIAGGILREDRQKNRENSTTKSTAERESQPTNDEPTSSPPEIAREGFFAKISDLTTTFTDEAGLIFQERLFKRPTTDSITVGTPETETETEVAVVSEEPSSILDAQPETSEGGSLTKKPKKNGDAVLSFPQRFFKRTATETEDRADNSMDPGSRMSPSQEGSVAKKTEENLMESSPKPSFMLKLRHKFLKPNVLPDVESAQKSIEEPAATSDAKNTEATTLSLGSSSNIHDSRRRPGPVTSSSLSKVEPAYNPPPFDADTSSTSSGTLTRSFSTMKRAQTRFIVGDLEDPGSRADYLAPPSGPPPNETTAAATSSTTASTTRSLSTMKRDQTRVISRDQNCNATDVLVQTPGGLQLMPGQSRVVSTDESRVVASELHDLREYIRVLEADLGRRTPGEYLPVAPPRYDETS
ncbi:hypothetical protein B0H17DRAFT_1205354 [Mycena rosella]|uniref:Uncharacterized protein n=1 Tax=Mycena rosella TaxID=1033263 RepID=A0AAD7DAV0_MYCRO|nr:hypothetical protein B0H17DRAFT_1205354 [Mycena rosella]